MAKRVEAANKKALSTARVRVTITFPPDMYGTLAQIAEDKKVSLAWVVREAAEQYIGSKWPLFEQGRQERR